MTNNPEEIRQEIEETRRELGNDVDALADKVSPSSIAQRQTEKVKGFGRKIKDNVMGVADNATSHLSDAASHVGDAASHAGSMPSSAVSKAKGNPVAVGVIAFGVGLLAASLIPASNREKQLGQTVKEKAAPLVDDLKETAKGVAEDLKEPAMDAADSVKGAATEAVANVKDDAKSQTDDIKGNGDDSSADSQGDTGTYSTEGYVSPDGGGMPPATNYGSDDTLR
jgi:gas vesicle protein